MGKMCKVSNSLCVLDNSLKMKLEYLEDLTDGGKYTHVVSENLIRLSDFDENQTVLLIKVINNFLVTKEAVELSDCDFIEAIDCKLLLQLSNEDLGILKAEKSNTFTCNLTEKSYTEAIELMKATSEGYNWLSITSNENIDFLYSSGGTW